MTSIQSKAQMKLLFCDFKRICTDCTQTKPDDMEEWCLDPPVIKFNIIKSMQVGHENESKSGIIAEGQTYQMKEVMLKPNQFNFEVGLGAWVRFYENDVVPVLDESGLDKYGWEVSYEEFDTAVSPDDV